MVPTFLKIQNCQLTTFLKFEIDFLNLKLLIELRRVNSITIETRRKTSDKPSQRNRQYNYDLIRRARAR